MQNEIIIHNAKDLKDRIYSIRNMTVMFDFDLANIYGYDVRTMNQQVKRNINRFPEDFMFQITKVELEAVRSQFVISPKTSILEGQDGGRRSLPYVFTEQGVYMLAAVLRGEMAENQSIFIMRAFRELKHYVQQNRQFVTKSELQLLTENQKKTADDVKQIQKEIVKINEQFVDGSELKEFVIYKGQKLEADKAYIDIYKLAKASIYLVDDYMNIKTLDLLKNKKSNVNVIIFTENKKGQNGILTSSIVNDFNVEYPSLIIKPNPDSHDRFIIIDYNTSTEQIFHSGASSKDAGNKICSINKFDDKKLLHPFIDNYLRLNDKGLK